MQLQDLCQAGIRVQRSRHLSAVLCPKANSLHARLFCATVSMLAFDILGPCINHQEYVFFFHFFLLESDFTFELITVYSMWSGLVVARQRRISPMY
jgi:hypothetical protein